LLRTETEKGKRRHKEGKMEKLDVDIIMGMTYNTTRGDGSAQPIQTLI
jgi:hypothetical protein